MYQLIIWGVQISIINPDQTNDQYLLQLSETIEGKL